MILILLILLAVPNIALAGKLDIEYARDTAYLPYRYVEEYKVNLNTNKKINNSVFLYDNKSDINGGYHFIIAKNEVDAQSARISCFSFLEREVIEDDNVYMVVEDCVLQDNLSSNMKSIMGVGYKNDTAWVFKLFPDNDSLSLNPLEVGHDGDGDGKWIPKLNIHLLEDYDYDSVEELFVFLRTEREFTPRLLFCVNANDLSIEWKLEVSSNVYELFNCRDSANPSVIFCTANPSQGATDENYKDVYRYLSKINSNGDVVCNKVISINNYSTGLIKAELPKQYYVIHTMPFMEPDSIYQLAQINRLNLLPSKKYFVSKIDQDFNVLISRQIAENPLFMLLHKFEDDDALTLLISFKSGRIRSYTTSLQFISESEPVPLRLHKLNTIDLPDHEEAIVFRNGIYSDRFSHLLQFSQNYNKCIHLECNSDSNFTRILLSGLGKISIGRIEKKSFLDLVSVFYHTNQIYILMTLSGFFVGLIVVNYYRSRTKSNLKIISVQKTELEETHQKLKEAQAKILAQEKYRQARDIAGGFAHEIRNALSPARNALSKLTSDDITIAKDVSRVQKLTRFTDSAIERAITMTNAISRYTKIEEMRQPGEVILLKVIDKAIEINYHRIEDQNIRINKAIDNACKVLGNEEQLIIVFNNLLINSLDALTGTAQPSILVRSHTNEQYEVVEFRDNGSGINRESLERIFDVFYSTKPDRGTGIGLTMAKKIIEIYDGSITAESVPGEFTSFKILLRRIRNQKENTD